MESPTRPASKLTQHNGTATITNGAEPAAPQKMRKTSFFQHSKLGLANSKHAYLRTLFTHTLGKESHMTHIYAAILPSFFFILGMLFIISFMH